MNKNGPLYARDIPSLKETSETNNKKSKLFSLENYISDIGGRGESTHSNSIGLSSKWNNLQHVFEEEYLPTKSFKESKKFYSTQSMEDNIISKRLNKVTKINNDESDENDENVADQINSITTRSHNGCLGKSKYSFNDDTPLSKKFFNSHKIDDLKNDNSTFINSTKIYSSSFVNNTNEEIHDTATAEKILTNKLSSVVTEGDMNFIMLVGLFMGLVVSKVLKCLQLYLNWLLDKIVQVRNVLLGTNSIWQFINLNDENNIQMQYKLILIPFGFISMFMYGFLYILYSFLRFLLASAPSGLIKFIQNLHKY